MTFWQLSGSVRGLQAAQREDDWESGSDTDEGNDDILPQRSGDENGANAANKDVENSAPHGGASASVADPNASVLSPTAISLSRHLGAPRSAAVSEPVAARPNGRSTRKAAKV